MKFLIEAILALILHPIAVVLAWINIARRRDLTATKKVLWAIICLVWGIGPLMYIMLGDGALW